MAGPILLVGGAGFIGSHVADELVGAGHAVRVLDRPGADWQNLAGLGDRIDRVQGDAISPADLTRALEGCAAAVHLAGATVPAASNADPVGDVEANLVPSLRLLEAARATHLPFMVFLSSGGTIYGRARATPITEDHPTDPLCSYGVVKLAVEKYLELFRHLHGLDYAIARLANAYGERQRPQAAQGAVGVFLGRVQGGRPIDMWGAGDVVRDYIHVADIAYALRLLVERRPPGRLFNVGTGVGTSLAELVDEIRRVTQRPVTVNQLPARALDVPVNVLDASRLRLAVGWAPRETLSSGLRRTWAWMHKP